MEPTIHNPVVEHLATSIPDCSAHPEGLGADLDMDANDSTLPETNFRPDLYWFDKCDYTRIVEEDAIRYIHSTAGRPLRRSTTTWEDLRASREKSHPKATYFPFPNRGQWQLAHWLATCKASQSKIDELLAMDGVFAETPCFQNAGQLFKMIENDVVGFGGPEWFEQDITLPEAPDEPLTMYLRNIEDCADYLLGRPDLAGDIQFQPEVIFEIDDKTQIINEIYTAYIWHKLLKMAGEHEDAGLGGLLLGSDVTHLSHYSGDVKVHGVYVSLGNIRKEIRNHTSRRAWMLVAYIPISKWEVTLARTEFRSKQHRTSLPGILNRRLFHHCMTIICEPLRELNTHEVVDPEGHVRLIFYILIAYLADLEEQYKIAALDKSNCIHCEATTTEFGSPEKRNPRSADSILKAIKQVQLERGTNADPYEFALGSDKYRLGDVEFPFWELLPFVDICNVLSVDLLHGFHKFFFDHPFQWNTNSLGEDELDARMKSQVALVGGRVFPRGVTHITQMSGKEHRALETVHLGVVANAPIQYSREITLVTRALLDFTYLAQLPSHTDDTLALFEDAYDQFHQNKEVWIKNGARQGEKGNVINHFNIPKLHTAGHLLSRPSEEQ